jgi:hypothetical protein
MQLTHDRRRVAPPAAGRSPRRRRSAHRLALLVLSLVLAACGGSSAPEGDNRTGSYAGIGWDLNLRPTMIDLVEGSSATVALTFECTDDFVAYLVYVGQQLPPPLATFIEYEPGPQPGPLPDPRTLPAFPGAPRSGLALACTPARPAVATMRISAPIPTGYKQSSLAFALFCGMVAGNDCAGASLLGGTQRTTVEVRLPLGPGPGGSAYGVNLLDNPGFSAPVVLGLIPSAPGGWQGDLAASVPAEQGIVPRSAPAMLRFDATGDMASVNNVSSQQWQIVDVSALAADIGAGRVRADASAWFNRVAGDASTDRRFDSRLLAFSGIGAGLPAAYAAGSQLAVQVASIQSAGNGWEQAALAMTLPAGTTLLLVEIYAFEDVANDGAHPEFAGHYADDIVLVLTRE